MVVRVSTVSRCSAPLTVSVTSASIGGGTFPRQCCGYGLGYEAWLVDHLPPGEAEGSEPHHRVDGVASAVFLESLRRQVGGSAVGLDDELLRAPEEVDFLFAHHCVHLLPRQLRIEDEGEEPLLEHGAGDVRLPYLQPFDRGSQRLRSPASGSGQLLIEGARIEEAEVLGAVDEALGLVRGEGGGEVDQGAGDGGEGEAVDGGEVLRLQSSMHSDLRRRSCVGEGAHVELRG